MIVRSTDDSALVAAYDAVARDWEILFEGTHQGVVPCAGASIVPDPVNDRIVCGGTGRGGVEGFEVLDELWAFDLRTGEWTVLLPASDGGTSG